MSFELCSCMCSRCLPTDAKSIVFFAADSMECFWRRRKTSSFSSRRVKTVGEKTSSRGTGGSAGEVDFDEYVDGLPAAVGVLEEWDEGGLGKLAP